MIVFYQIFVGKKTKHVFSEIQSCQFLDKNGGNPWEICQAHSPHQLGQRRQWTYPMKKDAICNSEQWTENPSKKPM